MMPPSLQLCVSFIATISYLPWFENIVLISTEYNNYSGEVTQGGLIPRVILFKGDMRVNETWTFDFCKDINFE